MATPTVVAISRLLENAAEDMTRALAAIGCEHALAAHHILEIGVMRIEQTLARIDAADAAIAARLFKGRPTTDIGLEIRPCWRPVKARGCRTP